MTEKECLACHLIKPLDSFSPSVSGRLGRKSMCKPCNVVYTNERRRERKRREKASTKVCECGRSKLKKDEACPSCSELDGTGAEARLISAFRVHGYVATIGSLADDLGVDERSVYRSLAVLRKSGRVEMVVPDNGHGFDRGKGRSWRGKKVKIDDELTTQGRAGRAISLGVLPVYVLKYPKKKAL